MKVTKKSGNSVTFKEVELREALVADMLAAERISGKAEGYEFSLALLSQIGTFDGQALPPDELRRLSVKDFLAIAEAAGLGEVPADLPTGSSTSAEKQGSASNE